MISTQYRLQQETLQQPPEQYSQEPHNIQTSLVHLKWLDLYKNEKPFQVFINIPSDAEDRRATNLEWEELPRMIHDIRGREQNFSLDDHGFMFRTAPSRVHLDTFLDRKAVEAVYLPEVEELIRKELSDVQKVFFFDWRLRRNNSERKGTTMDLNDPTDYLHPAQHVHVDQSVFAVLNRIKLQIPDEAEELLKKRVRVINVWRPLRHAVEDWPLALCDGKTVKAEDLIETDHIRRHYTGSTLYLLGSERHKWYYLNQQRPEEVLIFKNFDSAKNVKAHFTPHGSFLHDRIRPGAPTRESVEVRALVFS